MPFSEVRIILSSYGFMSDYASLICNQFVTSSEENDDKKTHYPSILDTYLCRVVENYRVQPPIAEAL